MGAPPAGGDAAARSIRSSESGASISYVPVTYTTVTSDVTVASLNACWCPLHRAHKRARESHDARDRELLGLREDQPRAVLGHRHQQPREQLGVSVPRPAAPLDAPCDELLELLEHVAAGAVRALGEDRRHALGGQQDELPRLRRLLDRLQVE